ncbi:MAG: hypothetical protein CBD97_00730 [Pelagibacteraceae bacterium TMED237]|nr:dihydroorotase [Candidatus Neomarinimicrobiota bacterium]OUW96742.1 MAG: hypothetical protein CBD97_00730 [Pelagibacteraceae bacterium TMED237]|tara:strand:+ start:1345 stop:2661 length:1317 start_codon:yes stop_codon:yes gene_type:complete
MHNKTLLIKNGSIVSSKHIIKSDLFIKNGKISKIGMLDHLKADRTINALNQYILPGIIDPQVHFRDPGLTHKEDIQTGSMCAASGGVTTFFEMPNTKPSTTTIEKLNKKYEVASSKSLVNYSFFLGATSNNSNEIKKLSNNCGLKIFMGSSTGDLLVDNEQHLEEIFAVCNRLIAVHAEDEEILNESAKLISGTDFSNHTKARPVEAAVKATEKAIKYALKYKRKLHILHLSTAEEVKIIRAHKKTGLITCETTPQHLLMEAPDIYKKIGAFAQMNPPIREKRHQNELWRGLLDGTIDCIATDHAPHTIDEKNLPYGQAPSGMPGVETSLTLMLNQVSKGNLKLENIVSLMSENAAKIYNIKNKGLLKTGYDADIVIIDMEKEKVISNKNMKTKCKWSAFNGKKTKGWPITTIVNGDIVYENEKLNMNVRGSKVLFNY